jgi:hypothetical protein
MLENILKNNTCADVIDGVTKYKEDVLSCLNAIKSLHVDIEFVN